MDGERARRLIEAERRRIESLLAESASAAREDRVEEGDAVDRGDQAVALAAEGGDDAVEASLRERLAALSRAERRIDEGTFGLSVRSGRVIPDERLAADPAAELTVDEAGGP